MTGELKSSWVKKRRQNAAEVEEAEGLASLMPSSLLPSLSIPMDQPSWLIILPSL